ncbi:MAG TPA: methionine--tRNA ligase [Candidatus Sulfomarinibacteraceae bacterium]|nr:methionine--tRNA ligase [Candidatus Sulfomarinibacteraceae bacterium]
MTDDVFYVTTPIYYVNDVPHLGHAYTTILADVLARYACLRGAETYFLTGTDEHGQKVQEAAEKRGVSPRTHVDTMVRRFQDAWRDLHVQYDDFIRTTESRHTAVVRQVLQKLWERGDIYLAEYEGWYCVPDERFWTEKDLAAGNCPDCGRQVTRLVEPNYFFRMSSYQEWLIDYINEHPSFLQPEHRRNEVLGFLRQPLSDLCISRPRSRLSWGIPLPFDEEYVTYVWFDALLNYVTAVGYGADGGRFDRFWPQALHLIGKDILITHAVYWPSMLEAAGLAQPRTILAHGWWIARGTKMSKSRGNVVRPLELTELYGVDALRYFLMRDMVLGRDANFSQEALDRRYHAELANDLGNLLHRLLNMLSSYTDGRIPHPARNADEDTLLQQQCTELPHKVQQLATNMAVNEAVALTMDGVTAINRYLERTAPWTEARAGNSDRVVTVLYTASEALRLCSVLLWPVLPERMERMWAALGWRPPERPGDGLQWGLLAPGTQVQTGAGPLFPRVEQ